MDISNMFRPALSRITSSMASTANYGFTRVLSFTGSFNDRTNLLLRPAQEQELTSPSSQAQEAPAPVTSAGDTFDIEAATPPSLSAGEGPGEEPAAQDAESKRVAKSVQTVCLFAASASLVLFVNLPNKDPSKPAGAGAAAGEHGAVLYSVDLAFICLGLFTSLGLSMFSIVSRPGGGDPAAVARVQRRVMVMAVAFVLVSFTLRMYMMLPAASLESAWLVFVLLAGVVAVYLSLAWKFGGGRRAETLRGSDGAGVANRV